MSLNLQRGGGEAGRGYKLPLKSKWTSKERWAASLRDRDYFRPSPFSCFQPTSIPCILWPKHDIVMCNSAVTFIPDAAWTGLKADWWTKADWRRAGVHEVIGLWRGTLLCSLTQGGLKWKVRAWCLSIPPSWGGRHNPNVTQEPPTKSVSILFVLSKDDLSLCLLKP